MAKCTNVQILLKMYCPLSKLACLSTVLKQNKNNTEIWSDVKGTGMLADGSPATAVFANLMVITEWCSFYNHRDMQISLAEPLSRGRHVLKPSVRRDMVKCIMLFFKSTIRHQSHLLSQPPPHPNFYY